MMQCKIKRELEIVDQSQTPRYITRFEPLLYVSAFTQKNFHYNFHTGLSTLRIWVNTTRSTQLLSSTNTISTQEARHN